jgi:hypothetical protein
MVGGIVIEVCDIPDRPGVLYVDCAERPYSKIQTCAIHVEKNATSDQITVGDSVWWQGRIAYWTPQAVRATPAGKRDGKDYDIPIPRVGYSGVPHPLRGQEPR